jgi:hypothetical protein
MYDPVFNFLAYYKKYYWNFNYELLNCWIVSPPPPSQEKDVANVVWRARRKIYKSKLDNVYVIWMDIQEILFGNQ